MKLKYLFLVSLSCSQPSFAALNINVSGIIGTNSTLWEFDGSYETANTFNFTLDDGSNFGVASTSVNQFDGDTEATGGLDFTESHNFAVFSTGSLVSGAVLASDSGQFQALGLLFDDDNGAAADDFAWVLGNGEVHQFSPTETITFTNYTVAHAGFDISDFDQDAPGASISQNGDFFTTSSNDLGGLTLNFTAIPEPSSTFLSSLALGLSLLRRKRNP